MFNRIAIIGLGLIGSSVARAAHERGLAKTIAGYDADKLSSAYALKHGFIDLVAQSPAEAISGSRLVILAVPPSSLADIAKAIAPHLEKGAIVMDTCSVKQAAIDMIVPHLPQSVEFIPAHPIAGSEQSGVSASKKNLFEHRRIIVTPDKPAQTPALQTAISFWKALGARVEAMPPATHDLIYAHVSHLPHLLAFAAAQALAAYKEDKSLQKFLRLSGSNPTLWAEIFLLNQQNVLTALDRYIDAVSHMASELATAPANNVSENDSLFTHATLFPRIAASCLITTVMQAERKAGFPFARYAGPGFADFTSPAAVPPEEDIESISGQYQAMAAILEAYIGRLKAIRAALSESGDVRKTLHM